MLYEPPALDAQETEVLRSIELLKRELDYAVAHRRRWFGVMRRNTFARAIQGSNTIEGYNVTMEDAVAAIEEEEPIHPKTESWYAVAGYRQAMTLILQKHDDPHFSYAIEFLNSLQYMMTSYDLTKNPGRWRPGAIWVKREDTGETVYNAPPVESVPGLMTELLAYLNTEDSTPPLVRAALAHLNLVLIHPYSDGNGRMARALQTLVLARAGHKLDPVFIGIEEYLGRNTLAYYEVLAQTADGKWSPERSTKTWIRFCLTAHYRQLNTLKQRNEQLASLWGELENEVRKLGLPERSIPSLANAALGFRIRNPNYRNDAEVSLVVAGRDLKALVRAELLVANGERRGRFYSASGRLAQIARGIPRPLKVEDPFERKPPDIPGLS
jgi:Fic family protein